MILPISDIRPRSLFYRPGNATREWPSVVSSGSIMYNQTPWSCQKNTLRTIASTQLLEFQPLKPLTFIYWLIYFDRKFKPPQSGEKPIINHLCVFLFERHLPYCHSKASQSQFRISVFQKRAVSFHHIALQHLHCFSVLRSGNYVTAATHTPHNIPL